RRLVCPRCPCSTLLLHHPEHCAFHQLLVGTLPPHRRRFRHSRNSFVCHHYRLRRSHSVAAWRCFPSQRVWHHSASSRRCRRYGSDFFSGAHASPTLPKCPGAAKLVTSSAHSHWRSTSSRRCGLVVARLLSRLPAADSRDDHVHRDSHR